MRHQVCLQNHLPQILHLLLPLHDLFVLNSTGMKVNEVL